MYNHFNSKYTYISIGNKTAKTLGLACGMDANSCGHYNPKIDPSTLNENSNAAFRLFHMYVPSNVRFIKNGNPQLIVSQKMSNIQFNNL